MYRLEGNSVVAYLRGVVVTVRSSKYVKKRNSNVASVEIADETGSMIVSFWGRKANDKGLCVGDVAEFSRVWIKKDLYRGKLQGSLVDPERCRVMFRHYTKTWSSDVNENEKAYVKRVLDRVSKRYPHLLRESRCTESAIRKILSIFGKSKHVDSLQHIGISVDVVIVSLKYDEDVLVVTARGEFDRDIKVSIRYFQHSNRLGNMLNSLIRSETRCTISMLTLDSTIDPKAYGVSAVLNTTRATRIVLKEKHNTKVLSLKEWLSSLNERTSRPVCGKIRACVSNLHFPSLASDDELNSGNLIKILSSDRKDFKPFKIVVGDDDTKVWIYVPSNLAFQLLGAQSPEDIVKNKAHALCIVLNAAYGLANMHKNAETVEMDVVAYFQRGDSGSSNMSFSGSFVGDDVSAVSWLDFDIELRGMCFI